MYDYNQPHSFNQPPIPLEYQPVVQDQRYYPQHSFVTSHLDLPVPVHVSAFPVQFQSRWNVQQPGLVQFQPLSQMQQPEHDDAQQSPPVSNPIPSVVPSMAGCVPMIWISSNSTDMQKSMVASSFGTSSLPNYVHAPGCINPN